MFSIGPALHVASPRHPASVAFLIAIVLPLSSQEHNRLANGEFENGLDGWTHLAANDARANYEADSAIHREGNSSLKATVTAPGVNAWDAQSISPAWTAVASADYSVHLWARAAAPSTIRLVVQDIEGGGYQAQDIDLSTEWTEHRWTVTASADQLQLKIHYFEAGTFWIDDIRITGSNPAAKRLILDLDPYESYQTMLGFGGALTWYSERVLESPDSSEILDLIFKDLGLDILRLANWYYPADYPGNTRVEAIPAGDRALFDATQAFAAMARDAGVPILLSSWGPPASLKSNNHLREGTLKKEDGRFVYEEYVQYWIDSLDHLGFVPDYLSMQNEPGYTNPAWTTTEWRPGETEAVAGYAEAFTLLVERLRERSQQPLLIGPEVENIGAAVWDDSVNTFRAFNEPLKGNEDLHAYAYHLYNLWDESRIETDIPHLHMIRDAFGEKPNFMTEFSKTEYGAIETAHIIQNSLTEANTAAYIYWNLVWDPNPDALIGVANSGSYSVGENYYALKHFARHIDAGFSRIHLSGSSRSLKLSAFLAPTRDRVVIIAVNTLESEQLVDWQLGNLSLASLTAFRTTAAADYAELTDPTLAGHDALPARSITSYVLDLPDPLPPRLRELVIAEWQNSTATGPFRITVEAPPATELSLWHSSDLEVWSRVDDITIEAHDNGSHTLTDPKPIGFPAFYQVRATTVGEG